MSVLGHNTLTSSQPVLGSFSLPDPPWIFFFTWSSVDLFLYLILRGSFSLPDPPWIFFFTWSSLDLSLFLILRGSFSLPDPPWIFFFTWSSLDLCLFLILRGSFSLPDPPWIFFFTWSSVLSRYHFCLFISVLSLQIQLSKRQRAVIQFFNILPDTCLFYKSQARNWISIYMCCGLFF